jgi:hypothetical protein
MLVAIGGGKGPRQVDGDVVEGEISVNRFDGMIPVLAYGKPLALCAL